ncbi:chemotaxis protein CheW [Oculatella sp. LEGE 06141]|uniref:chemotaxis protein CheW n=1 Tax=Oculatella sp. LEGE 06141 TaxID=1828648 RepID=UPI001880E26C|nr:chemotaxis protein CheW [Oculatella sp. LEGE 06141]MBE9181889.1 chemotaxis protein CheW [Oculatella sp. LEGE 06141]
MDSLKPMEVESDLLSATTSWQERYLLTKVGQQQIAFPSQWVAEIIRVERSQVLSLPFYTSTILGVFHHRGEIVPLFSYQASLTNNVDPVFRPLVTKEILQVIRLNQSVKSLSGVGLVVEQVVGNISAEELLTAQPTIRRFDVEDIPQQDWQPAQRWSNAIN